MFSRMSLGWQIARNAMKVLNANKQLIIFPVLSAITTVIVALSFFSFFFFSDRVSDPSNGVVLLTTFLFYVCAYFISVFFNMALIHCTTLYFRGEEASVAEGLSFSVSRIRLIFAWAVFAATVGTALKVIQDNLGQVGKLITGILGLAWSVGTFFVVPVIAYEKLGPYEAIQRSIQLMKEKWGESISARFSFGIIILLFMLAMGIVAIATTELVNDGLGVGVFVAGFVVMMIVISAVRTIITAAVYHSIDADLDVHFNKQMLEGLFEPK